MESYEMENKPEDTDSPGKEKVGDSTNKDEIDANTVPERSPFVVYLEQHVKDITLIIKVLIGVMFLATFAYLVVHNIVVGEERKKDIPDYLIKGFLSTIGAPPFPITHQKSNPNEWIRTNATNSAPFTMSPEIQDLMEALIDYLKARLQRA